MSWTDDFVVAYDTYGDGSDYSTLFSYHGDDEDVVIPEYVDAIAKGAFRDNTYVQTVDLSNVCDIGEEAFMGCTSLERVDLHLADRSLTVGTRAFAGCRALTTVVLSGALSGIDSNAFEGCTALESNQRGEPTCHK